MQAADQGAVETSRQGGLDASMMLLRMWCTLHVHVCSHPQVAAVRVVRPYGELIPQLRDPRQQAGLREVIHVNGVVAEAPVGVQHQQHALLLQQAGEAVQPAQGCASSHRMPML